MIARKSALIILIQFLNGILGYIGLKYISLYMQPWEYGVVGFAYGFVALIHVFGLLGYHQAHIKKISEGKNLGTCQSVQSPIDLKETPPPLKLLYLYLHHHKLHRGWFR